MQPEYLPMSQKECRAIGWDSLDVIIVTGDAYVDHPAFGAALIGRALVAHGFTVGVIAQPDWHGDADFLQLGRPRLFFGVTAGNMDSMINHYTARKKIRSDDAYSPHGKAGLRPDRATLIYTQQLRRLFKGVPVVIGGIEASMRRIPHYDYWSDTVRNSILFDSKADILVYGMGEKAVVEVARRMSCVSASVRQCVGPCESVHVRVPGPEEETHPGRCGSDHPSREGTAAIPLKTSSIQHPVSNISDVPGTVVAVKQPDGDSPVILPSWEESKTPEGFWKMSKMFHTQFRTAPLFQPFAGRYLKHNLPAAPMTTEEMDEVYGLPFARAPHPQYKGAEIPAFTQIKESVTAHRGCFGGCAFCALGYHQGKTIQPRSIASVKKEISRVVNMPWFTGIISDVGGPTANMYGMSCRKCVGALVRPCGGEEGTTSPVPPLPRGTLQCADPCPSVPVCVAAADQAQPSNLPIFQPPLPATCVRDSCVFPEICPNLDTSHETVRRLLKECRGIPGVLHVYVSSGVRFDLALRDEAYIADLARHHTGGRLKVAPEHTCASVLRRMHKPDIELFEQFSRVFLQCGRDGGRRQEIVPYLMVGHPGTTLQDAIELSEYLKRHSIQVEQVQEFTPTPMTPSTCMYYTGRDFETGEVIHVPKGREVRLQKALAQWFMPENEKLVKEARRSGGGNLKLET